MVLSGCYIGLCSFYEGGMRAVWRLLVGFTTTLYLEDHGT